MKIDPKKITLSQSEIEEAIKIWLLSKLDNDREEVGTFTYYAGAKTHSTVLSDCTVSATVVINEKVKKK